MAVIKKRGSFDFICSTPSYKKLNCIMKDMSTVTIDFNKLEITYVGTVRVWAEQLGKFITLNQILPSKDPEDDKYFTFISSEINLISQKRKDELKQQQKQRRGKQKMTA